MLPIARLFAMVVLFSLCSCDSFVEVELPNNQLTGPAVFEDRNTADAALGYLFASVRDDGMLSGSPYGLSVSLGTYADELDFYGTSSVSTFYFFNNSVLSNNTLVGDYWDGGYHQIYTANAIIEGVAASSGIADAYKAQFRGEALFVRALIHFHLQQLFGDIPYVVTTDYESNRRVAKQSPDQVYTLLIADLEEAITLLPESYSTAGRARPNQFAAYALLSRIFLSSEQWAEASNAASAVLNQSALYQLNPDLASVFLQDSPETIWQLPPAISGGPTEEATTFILLASPPAGPALREDLVGSFQASDNRRSAWIGEINDGPQTFFYPHKYRQRLMESVSSEYSVVMRLAEIFLIRAEARARQGELTGAREDLDAVRVRAGLSPSVGVSQDELISAILEERRHELFSERGHRFFDLKRYNRLDTVLGEAKPGWSSHNRLLPLPQRELLLNENLLPQNNGY